MKGSSSAGMGRDGRCGDKEDKGSGNYKGVEGCQSDDLWLAPGGTKHACWVSLDSTGSGNFGLVWDNGLDTMGTS